jgi:hypothetical protein
MIQTFRKKIHKKCFRSKVNYIGSKNDRFATLYIQILSESIIIYNMYEKYFIFIKKNSPAICIFKNKCK